MKKGEIYEVKIDEVRFPNKGIGSVDGERVVLKNVMPGQTVRFIVQKKRSDHFIGRVLEVTGKSVLETRQPLCSLFPECGGCTYQTMGYTHQLVLKAEEVKNILAPVLERYGVSRREFDQDLFEGIAHSEKEFPYRNKMEYTFGDECKGGELTLGLHKKGSNFDILPCTDCRITHRDYNDIVRCVMNYCREKKLPYYHRMSHEGFLRNLLVRRAEYTGEIMIALVTTTQIRHDFSGLTVRLLSLGLEGEITGILHMEFDGVADIVRSEHTEILYGKDHIYDNLFGLSFRISPFSFFQTNTRGAEVLYGTVKDYIGDIVNAEVFDLYSGTGTIAQILSETAGHVTAVEIVEEAVEAAKMNAAENGIENCTFLCGDVLKMLDEIENRPDYIILDPPRDGINPKALSKIIDYGAERIVYVSCKPTSLARDLEMLLAGGYEVVKVKCVDMFPETVHVETVCCLYHPKKDFISVPYEPNNVAYL